MRTLGNPLEETTMFATPNNEAFTLLCLENGEVEWLHLAKKKYGLKFQTDHDLTTKEKPSIVEHILDWEFTTSMGPGMEGYIVDPKTDTHEDLEQAVWERNEIETAVQATLKPLPTNYLDDEAVETEEADNDNDTSPTKKKEEAELQKIHK
jgi:hypothetical protein